MIKVTGLSKSYNGKNVFADLTFEIKDTGITVISGASGKGKTTLARILAGLEKSYGGEIRGIENKKISLMFQEDRLFEHLSALENVSLVCSEKKAQDILKYLELENSIHLKPSQLSGGMCRRVALARAISFEGDILILDEPFKGLDITLKEKAFDLIKNYSKNHCVILISHDENEINQCDDVIELNMLTKN